MTKMEREEKEFSQELLLSKMNINNKRREAWEREREKKMQFTLCTPIFDTKGNGITQSNHKTGRRGNDIDDDGI